MIKILVTLNVQYDAIYGLSFWVNYALPIQRRLKTKLVDSLTLYVLCVALEPE